MASTLNSAQIQQFQDQGYLLLEDAIDASQIASVQAQFAEWVEESKSHSAAYGSTQDGRPRFDVESDHTPEHPALRRVASPTELSPTCLDIVKHSAASQAVAELIGPNVRFHHSKFNSKQPKASTVVKWHQDFPFTPHSNDDTVTVLIFVDDVTLENGPLLLAPGSHKGELHSLWHDGVFTGAMSDEAAAEFEKVALPCTGKSGSACLMSGRVAHASRANHSDAARTLFIYNLTAADAVPLSPNPLPSEHEGLLVAGVETGRLRVTAFDIELPEVPKGASFFTQQSKT